jgi:hypothetical protein
MSTGRVGGEKEIESVRERVNRAIGLKKDETKHII